MTNEPLRLFSRSVVFSDCVKPATIVAEAGQIVEIRADTQDPRAINLGGDLIVPGLVELHTDHLEPHFSPRPKVTWDPMSAVFAYDAQIAASGITTVFDSLRLGRDDGDKASVANALHDLSEALETAKTSGLLRADHYLHLRCELPSEGLIEEAHAYLDQFDVRLISLMDHTPGQRQFRDEAKLRSFYEARSGMPRRDLDAMFDERKARGERLTTPNRRALVAIAKKRGIALASHDDTLEDHVAESLEDGVAIAEFPTTTEAARACHDAGIAVMMGAPNLVKGGSQSGNVSAISLAAAGTLDILSSDYVPISLLHGAMMLADVEGFGGLPAALRTVTSTPAQAAGLNDRGSIAVGKRADLVRVAQFGNMPVVREVWRAGLRVS